MNNDILIEAAEILLGILDEGNFSLPRNENDFQEYSKSSNVKNKGIFILVRNWKEAGSQHGPSVKVGNIQFRKDSISISIKSGTVPKKEARDKKKLKRLSDAISVGEQFVRNEQAALIALWNCNDDDEAKKVLNDIIEDRLKSIRYYKLKLKSVKTGKEFEEDAEEITRIATNKLGRDPKFKFTLDMRA